MPSPEKLNVSTLEGNVHAVQQISTVAVIIIAAYIAAQMLSDIASLKIGLVFNKAVDMGTFIYPITFTLRDLVHKQLGKKNARLLIIAAGIINFLMALYLLWTASVPGDPSWGLNKEYNAILSPVWRIVVASILAEVVSELIDTEAYQWFVSKVTSRFQWARVLFSNSVSVPVDNLIFALGAFAGITSWSVIGQIFIFNLIVKYTITVISIPLIYLIPSKEEGLKHVSLTINKM